MGFAGISIVSINIPNNVTGLGYYAFIDSVISQVTIPSSITTIPYYCFSSCMNLKSITIPSNVTTVMLSVGLV